MVIINGTNAHRVMKPKATRMAQKNSAKIANYREVATPKPSGSENRLRFSLKLAIFAHPWVRIMIDTTTLMTKRAGSRA